ncbi:sigma-70 family RNA polymerase sigma factor [Aequorivita antarctica]|uniref:Sigma-70 family RNA polymerase sigma factor n=1 Tax=Aequorivita antarctica TaxID=153266 RepID=A0A5C6Z1V5_9FLAO|nr:sigma-70 family RNA polymerase sigma factor [Aequorivita antarctica]TXD74044.1 sigma-70 family RNA polymerase sigma factor [Aequorivita antarctica]SRX73234.1 RNA polymerase sigma factor YlaC [Aequorivita antarctica]
MKKIEKYKEVSSLWIEYKSGLKYYILKKLKNEDLADELSHEVLMKIYNSCCSGNEIKNIKSWIYQIAHNTVIDYLKSENKFTNEVTEKFESDENNTYEEAEKFLEPLIKLLPDKYALPLLLSDIEGVSQIEVSKKMNLSLTATKSRIQRARKLLKEKIIECSNLEINAKGRPISIEIKADCKPLKKNPKNNN